MIGIDCALSPDLLFGLRDKAQSEINVRKSEDVKLQYSEPRVSYDSVH